MKSLKYFAVLMILLVVSCSKDSITYSNPSTNDEMSGVGNDSVIKPLDSIPEFDCTPTGNPLMRMYIENISLENGNLYGDVIIKRSPIPLQCEGYPPPFRHIIIMFNRVTYPNEERATFSYHHKYVPLTDPKDIKIIYYSRMELATSETGRIIGIGSPMGCDVDPQYSWYEFKPLP